MAQDAFMAPGAFDAEAENIRRRLRFSEMLGQQAQQAPQGQMVSGIYVAPSWTQHAANLLKAYSSKRGEESAMADLNALGEKRRQETLADALKIGQAMNGTPAMPTGQSYETGANEMGDDSATVPQWQEAKAGNRQQALALMLGSKNHAFQQLGMQQLFKQPEYVIGERFNAETGRKEKVIYDKSNPTNVMPFGGQEAVRGIAVNGQVVDPTKIGTVVPKQLEPDSILAPDGKGGFIPNQPVIQAKKEIAEAGRPSTQVNVNTATKPFLNEVGKGVGEQVVTDFNGARAAVQTLNNVNQIRSGLQNAITGPTAGMRIKLSQIGEVLGVNGKDATEQLQNTRNVIQGLARQELAAAQSMKGQGQITEAERSILRRAESGSVDEMTVPEIKTLLGALEKTANYRMGLHRQNMDRLKRDPNAAGVVDYMNVDVPGGEGWSITPR